MNRKRHLSWGEVEELLKFEMAKRAPNGWQAGSSERRLSRLNREGRLICSLKEEKSHVGISL